MFKYYPYLADAAFLSELDSLKCTTYYARITVLDMNDNPIESIEGYVTGGSLNKTGAAAVRVNGSLTIVADEFTYQIENIDNIIAINKKVDIEVGIENTLNKYTNYSVIWFPQGVMGITQASIQHNMSNYNISLNFKDKMAFLNGELGGTLPAPVDFSPLVDYDESTNTRVSAPTPIIQLIFTLVNELGGIPKNKIFISDIEKYLLNICSWSSSTDGLMRRKKISGTTPAQYKPTKLEIIDPEATVQGEHDLLINYGDILGYTPRQMVYPGKLSCNAGETIVSILDKIKNTLGNFEYFFDINGNFIFQKIRNFLNAGNKEENLENVLSTDYLMVGSDSYRSVYEFNDLSLVVSINNQPQYAKIKNDFNVWGKRNNLPIRYHLVLDEKPKVPDEQLSFQIVKDPIIIKTPLPQPSGSAGTEIQFEEKYNLATRYSGQYYCVPEGTLIPTGTAPTSGDPTGICQMYQYVSNEKLAPTGTIVINANNISTSNMDWRTYEYLKHVLNKDSSGYEKSPYAEELYANWPNLVKLETMGSTGSCDFVDTVWNSCYFLDIIDVANPKIASFNVKNIGRRTASLKEDSVNCLARPQMGESGSNGAPIIFSAAAGTTKHWREQFAPSGLTFLQVNPTIFNACVNQNLTTYSAFEHLRGALHEYITYNETVSLTVIPILHLEPNMRISIKDPETSVEGDFIINTLSIPLSANGTMNISAKKALERV